MKQEIRVPEVSDGVTGGQVIAVNVAVGERVEIDQTLLELETDKAVVALPSPFTGLITDILVKAGQQVVIGEVVMQGEPEDRTPAGSPPPAGRPAAVAPAGDHEPAPSGGLPPARTEPTAPTAVAPASPLVRRFARELGVDIQAVTGSGPGGRISEDDVREFVKRALAGGVTTNAAAPSGTRQRSLPDFALWGAIERRPLSQIRKIIAENMAYAWATAPHVTQNDKADITAVEAFRQDFNAKALPEGKLTMTAILLKITAAALRAFPDLNSSLDVAAGELVRKSYVHIGVAVDTPAGLLVPVIRDVPAKGLASLARELNDTAARARERRLAPAELEGGSFTISNLGGIGGTHFTPLVYAPQVAILGVSRAALEPVWDGREFQARLRLPLSLSYDHRVVDGADGARFLRWICAALEQPLLLMMEDS